MQAYKILVVEDDPQTQKLVEDMLKHEGYEVVRALDGADAVRKVESEEPDIILLDLMLPEMDGFDVCRQVRARYQTPIIVLSARGEEIDRVLGFRLGVDDYMTKPFSPVELALRVRAVLRRVKEGASARAKQVNNLKYPDFSISHRSRTVTVRGRNVSLTPKEFDLLWFLASNPNRVFTREQILDRVWGPDYFGDDNAVSVFIRRLRKRIEADPDRPHFLLTVWGVGYKFEVAEPS